MDNRNFAIGVLSTTAVVLLVGLVVVHSRPQPVMADGMTILAGDYSMTVGALTQVDEDWLYVIDNPEKKLISYRFNTTSGEIEVVQGIDLGEIRDMAEKRGSGKEPPKQRRNP